MSLRGLALTMLLAAFLTALGSRSGSMSAHAPHPGLNFWIAVSGMPGCDTKSGNSSCNLAPGSTFVVGVYLDSLPADLPQYAGFDVQLNYTGVRANRDASSSPWPECRFPVMSYDTPNEVVFGCAKGVPPAPSSSHSGLLGTNSFVCTQSGTIALAHGAETTDVVDDNLQLHAEDANTSETLTINCIQGGAEAPSPTPGTFRGAARLPPLDSTLEPTAAANATSAVQSQATTTTKASATQAIQTPGSGALAGGQSSSSGPAGWLIAAIVVGGTVVTGAAGAIGWRTLRNRRGSDF